MGSFVRRLLLALASGLAGLAAPLRGQGAPARLQAAPDSVPPRLASRVVEAVAHAWGVPPGDLVLSWGIGSLAAVPDSALFRLLGRGEGGWFGLVIEPPGRPEIAMRIRAGRTTEWVVASRALRRGAVLTAEDFRREPHVSWGPPAVDDGAATEPGWIARRSVVAGEPLDRRNASPPPVVEAGAPVRVLWSTGNVSVALEGVALNDAALGETVRIRTGRSVGVVRGTAIAPGEARMP
jgi:flagella basal body P-ring formation protein FlgA